MFAYCLNNPVVLTDSSGTAAHIGFSADGQLHDSPWKIGSPGGGGWPQGVCLSGNHLSEGDSLSFSEVLAILFNDDEQAVLEAEYFAFYKGCLVIRTNGKRSGSFGVLFITRETNTRDYPEDVIRHEYGHTVQLAQLGVVKYALCIGLPSLFEWGSDQEYYRRPWEITADIFGGVQSRCYPGYEAAGFEYLIISDLLGIGAWLTID